MGRNVPRFDKCPNCSRPPHDFFGVSVYRCASCSLVFCDDCKEEYWSWGNLSFMRRCPKCKTDFDDVEKANQIGKI